MGTISHYLREIGRGKHGARSLSREQATDLFGQVLDGTVSDLELGAFCIAMRIKGESADEMAGFLDATASRMARVPTNGATAVVIPSYNGARKLPVLTPLLGLLLAREGLPVVMHGTATEDRRVFVTEVLAALDVPVREAIAPVAAGELAFFPTERLSAGLKRLLDVRRAVGLRNSAHSLVKLMNPCESQAVIVSSYTHPEYAVSMAAVFERTGATALLLRGTEGEGVADARRLPAMDGFVRGERIAMEPGRRGTITDLPALPCGTDAKPTAGYIRAVLAGDQPVPPSVAVQVEHILRLATS